MSRSQEFFDAAAPLFEHYNAGEYTRALEIAEALAQRYPDQAAATYLWRICLTSRLDRVEAALQLLDRGLEAGYWWSERSLTKDPDLLPLQGLPEFERMVIVSEARHIAAQSGVKPELRVFQPSAAVSPPYPLLICLHGSGFTIENDNAPYWQPASAMGWLVAVPRSSQLTLPETYGWNDFELAEKEIAFHYETLCTQYPVDRQRIVIAGMSQGGALAIHMALARKLPVCAFLAVAPGNAVMDGLDELVRSAQGSGLRGYLVTGGRDPRHDIFKQIYALFLEHGIPCQLENHPELGHDFPPDFEQSLGKGLHFLLASGE